MSIAAVRPPVQSRRDSRLSRLRTAAVYATLHYRAAVLLDQNAAELVLADKSRETLLHREEVMDVLAGARSALLRAILAFSPNYAEKDTLRTRHENRAVRREGVVYVARYAEDDFDLEIGEAYPGCQVMRLKVMPGRTKRDLDRVDAEIVDLDV